MIKNLMARYVYEPLYCTLYSRDKRLSHYAFVKQAQWFAMEQNRHIQARKLYNLLKYASENIPYYKEVFRKHSIKISEKTIFEDLRKLPVLTKEDIRKEFSSLYELKEGSHWFYNTSGGSTGEPITILQDMQFESQHLALKRLYDNWAGCKVGDTQVRLWGSERDLLHNRRTPKTQFSNWMKSIYYLNSYSMGPEDMLEYTRIINQIKPKLIVAYAQSMNELAVFIEENKLKVHSPVSIITSATVLHHHYRENIERVFGCPVFNRYGSREVGDMACECDKHEGLHMSVFTHYLEILNSKLEPCKEGEKGEIYVTVLTNYTMPLIRYKIGDMAIHTDKRCSCGRGMPLIKEITGRTVDYFITKDGRKIDGLFFEDPIWKRDWLVKYQIVQKNPEFIEYRLMTKYAPPQRDIEDMKRMIKTVMGNECRIRIKLVDEIKPTSSGKYKNIIREFE